MADRLFKRGDTWYAWFYDASGKRYQRTTRQTDKRAAEATLREWERRAADPTYAASHETTLDDALRGMLRDRKLKGRAEGTLDCYRVKAGHLTRILGAEITLHEVTARTVHIPQTGVRLRPARCTAYCLVELQGLALHRFRLPKVTAELLHVAEIVVGFGDSFLDLEGFADFQGFLQ